MKRVVAGVVAVVLVVVLGLRVSSYREAYHRANEESARAQADLAHAQQLQERQVGGLGQLQSRLEKTSDWAWEFQARNRLAQERAGRLHRISRSLLRGAPAPSPEPVYAIGFGAAGADLETRGAAVQLPNGSLDLRRGQCRTRDFPATLVEQIKTNGAFSLEIAMPHNERLAPLLSLDAGPDQVNLRLVERNAHLYLLMGNDVQLTGLDADGPVHLVIVVEPGQIACYANGVLATEHKGVPADLSSWFDDCQWTLGSSPAGDENWPGELAGFAVHAGALTAADVHARWLAQVRRLVNPSPSGELRVLARLRSREHVDQGLSLYGYEVVRVLEGGYAHPRLQVCHWTEVDGESLRFRDALIGKTYSLTLVEAANVPALDGIPCPEAPEKIPVFYDAGGASLTYRGISSTMETEFRPDEVRPHLARARVVMKTDPTVGRRLRELTGRRTRVVWCRAVDNDSSLPQLAPGRLLIRSQFKLMGVDSDEAEPRAILEGPMSCCNPTLTWDGERVVYSDWPNQQICVVNWDGTDRRVLYQAPRTVMNIGYARESASGVEWAYFAECEGPPDQAGPVWRVDLARGEASLEKVWDQSSVSIWNVWSFSADGRHAAGAFPWPAMGILDLNLNRVVHATPACGMGLAPDDSLQYFHYVDGEHSELGLFSGEGRLHSRVSLRGAPGMDRLPWTAADRGTQTWLPRWSNDKRIFTFVGPVKGPGMFGLSNIYVARFAEDYSAVDGFVRVSNEPVCEAMSCVWVEPR